MKNRNTLIMSGLLALTLGLGVSGTAFAAQDFSKKSPGYSQQFESQMSRIMENNDYEGWKQLVLDKTGRIDPLINKENFPKFVRAWKLANEGKIKEANVIRNELGLRNGERMHRFDSIRDTNHKGYGHLQALAKLNQK